jgi:hypothetical protein
MNQPGYSRLFCVCGMRLYRILDVSASFPLRVLAALRISGMASALLVPIYLYCLAEGLPPSSRGK